MLPIKCKEASFPMLDEQENNQKLPDEPSKLVKLVTELQAENASLKEQLAALEQANQLIASSIQNIWQQGYQTAVLEQNKKIKIEEKATSNQLITLKDGATVVVNDPNPCQNFLKESLYEIPKPNILLKQTVFKNTADSKVANPTTESSLVTSNPVHRSTNTISEQIKLQEYIKEQLKNSVDTVNNNNSELKKDFSSQELAGLIQQHFQKAPVTNINDKNQEEQPAKEEAQPQLNKFVGTKHTLVEHDPAQVQPKIRAVPQEVRRSCKLLGLRPEELTKQSVYEAWKHAMSKQGVHPDIGGDAEIAVYLNTAKDILLKFLEDQAPKLGKVFGSTREPELKHNSKNKTKNKH